VNLKIVKGNRANAKIFIGTRGDRGE